jgi:uncharacterized surface anchored protein
MKKIILLLLLAATVLGVFLTPALAAGAAENYPLNSIVIKCEDIVTHSMLGGARFEIYYSNDAQSGGSGTLVATVDTDGSGVIVLSGIPSGYYIVRQTMPPNNYHLSINNEQHCFIKPDGTSIEELVFSNYRYGGLVVTLTDKDTNKPVAGATFSVTDTNGGAVGASADGVYTTDNRGEFYLENLPAGSYKITQLTAAQGYAMDSLPNTRTVRLQHTSADCNMFTASFSNSPLGTLLVRLKNSISKEPLSGAVFSVKLSGGADLGEFTTGANGSFSLPRIARGTYIISQVSAPGGYLIASAAKTVYVGYIDTYSVDFENKPKSGLYVTKHDKDTKAPLKDAKFQVYQDNTLIGTYATNAEGVFFIGGLEPGWYTVSESAAPQGYILDDTPKSVQVITETLHRLEFENSRLASLQIIKTDEFNGEPLAGARFRVTTQNGEFVGDVSTDASGKAVIPSMEPGWYVISETKAPTGYLVTEAARTVEVKATVPTVVTITNRAENNLEIVKLDFFTRAPLAGATFKVEHANGANIGTFNTDAAGKILIGNLKEGAYVVSEIKAPDGYQLDSEPQTVTIEGGKLHSVEFLDKPLSGIQIIKTDAVTHKPLSGATFEVKRADGETIGTYKTDTAGKIIVSDLETGTYIVSETLAPDGYIRSETPKTVVVASGKLTTVEFENKPLSGIQILKTDEKTNATLAGAVFTVERVNGERVGDKYTTDVAGKIIISDLTEGTYVVSETAAPDGYILDSAPQTVVVKSGKLTAVEFTNKPMAGMQIKKIDSSTRQPIAGVSFSVSKMNGERTGEFTTGRDGLIYLPELEPGWYTVTETKAANGYIIDSEPRNVEIKWGKSETVIIENTPMSGLLIVKTDEATGKPLAGVVFDIRSADGQFAAGSILDGNQPNTQANSPNKSTSPNGDITGSYTTDANGRIQINTLPAGEYHVTERKALDGYELDTDVHSVTVTPGKLAALQLTNRQKAGFRLLKIDSVTKKPIFGAEFMVFDANNKVVGNYITDNNGLIDFDGILAEGRYTIRETRPADGYYRDDMPRTVEFKSGKITEVVWENTPQMGQLQILTLSGNDNEVNGLPKKTPLSGSVFEIYQYKSGNLVDRFVSGTDGRAVSKPLPLGRYTVKQVQAPKWYRQSAESLDIEVEFTAQIIKREFYNYSANTGVKIRVTGNYEAMSGDTIRYNVKEVKNTSTVPLTDFYWRDVIPTSAVRLSKIVTGTYNQSLKYKILITTNKGDSRVIADNLSTKSNNVIDCRSAALGLARDEYVTGFTLVFGTVKAGFAQVTAPQVFVTVKNNLPNGCQFANKTDIGGKYGGEWVIGNSTWVTSIYAQPKKLPYTGY